MRHGDPLSTTIDPTPIAETVRELNQRRFEGVVADEEFNACKVQLFERASRR